MKKWIVGIIIALLFISFVFLSVYLDLDEDSLYVLSAAVVFLGLIIFGVRSFFKNRAIRTYNQTVIPENVGAESYIDKRTNAVHLRSYDYDTKGGCEWVVTLRTITINHNNNNTSQTISFSAIHEIYLNPTEPIGQLSISVLSTQSHMVADNIFEDRIVEVTKGKIFFFSKDIRIAQTIQTRFAK
ncbi:MAG: hypothetical protein FWE08_00235 [Oscillospiraceae bacterium]|nr:hypothetical protein [Oscillospiraceae bacterium]